jgi:hypothetical protein
MAAGSLGAHMVVDVAAGPSASLVSPGLAGFLVVVALGLVLWMLLRSMNKHLRRVELPEDDAESGDHIPSA